MLCALAHVWYIILFFAENEAKSGKNGLKSSIFKTFQWLQVQQAENVGDNGDEDPPVPIPNTEVKLVYGEST